MTEKSDYIAKNFLPPALRDGVRFACTQCGACCSGAPGKVRVTPGEIEQIAGFRGIPTTKVLTSAVRIVDGEWLLKERSNGDCIFLSEQGCSIHPVKPKQCRLYPFWFKNVRSDTAWAKTCRECPGIGTGEWVSPRKVMERVREDLS